MIKCNVCRCGVPIDLCMACDSDTHPRALAHERLRAAVAEIICEAAHYDEDEVNVMPFVDRILALAAGTQRAETSETSARAEGCQSGAAKTAQRPTSVPSSDKERE